jgi:hypothetical protein
VPAIQNDRTIGVRVALASGRPAAGLAASVRNFAAAAPELLLSIAIAHGRLVSRVPDNGNLSSGCHLLAAGIG